MKIVHAADIHLGRQRLDGRLSDEDFAKAFNYIADQAIAQSADVFLIAGDLFDHAQVEPPHLRQAQKVLTKLKTAGIRVIAIDGNHDRAFVHTETPSWLSYLSEDDLLVLLRTPFDSSGPILTPWNPTTRTGAWIDVNGVRFVGAGYLGAATPYKVREIANHLEAERCHVLLLHAGPDYFVGEGGGFSSADLQALHEKVCYLALGHIHKPMRHGNWACNPGAPENCELSEHTYGFRSDGTSVPRGFAVVKIDPTQLKEPLSIEICDTPRRPCLRVELDCTPFSNKRKDGVATLIKAAAEKIQAQHTGRETVIDLCLTGKVNLNRIALDTTIASTEIEKATGVCVVAIDTSRINLDESAVSANGMTGSFTREDLEKNAIRQLIEEEALWGIDGRQSDFAALFYELKEEVRKGRAEEDFAELILKSPLVDLVRMAQANPAPTTTPPPTQTVTEKFISQDLL